MADLSDVLNALVGLITPAVYPSGTGQPSIMAADIKVFPGWPESSQLEADILAGITNISVFPRPEEKVTSHQARAWNVTVQKAPGTTATVSGNVITFGGTPLVGDLIGVVTLSRTGASGISANFVLGTSKLYVDGTTITPDPAVSYVVQATDTPTTIATALAALIPGAISSGAVLTVPAAAGARVNIAQPGTALMELRRQEKLFQISIWANRPDSRDKVAAAVDAALSDVFRLAMPDGSVARTHYAHSYQDDTAQKTAIYRRDLFYFAEWATTKSQNFAAVVAPSISVAAAPPSF